MKRIVFILATIGWAAAMCGPAQAQGNRVLSMSVGTAPPVDTVTMGYKINQVSDLDFRNHQYTIDLILNLDYSDKCHFDFEKELEICNAKSMRVKAINCSNNGNRSNVRLRIKATIFQDWDVDGYPFDGQHLSLKIFDEMYDASRLVFKFENRLISKMRIDTSLEDGWTIHSERDTILLSDAKISYDEKSKYSSLNMMIDMHRKNALWLFLKLFIGMYVAFLVSYAALFIDVRETEARFGLAVGALFGAIGNKYIIESLLPQSPEFNVVDWLHSVTFLFIIIVIAFSIILLRLKTGKLHYSKPTMKFLYGLDKHITKIVLGSYVTINGICILWAHLHEVTSDKILYGLNYGNIMDVF